MDNNFYYNEIENNIHYNEADGTGYFFDGNDWYMMPRNTDETYDYECISRVDEMHSDGCSEQDIESVNTFLKVQILIRDLGQIKESYEGRALRGSDGPCDVKGSDGYMHQGIYMGSFFHPDTNQYYDQDDDGSWFRYETDREGYLDLHSRQPIEIGRIPEDLPF